MKLFSHARRWVIASLCTSASTLSCAATAIPVDLREGSLLSCLERVVLAFQVRIVDSSERVKSLECKASHENLTLDQALDRLLKPAGLDWHRLADGTIEIVASASAMPASMQLASLTIDGEPLSEPQRTLATAATPLAERATAITSLDKHWLDTAPILGFNQIGQYAPNVYGTGQSLSIRGIERDSDFFSSLTVSLDGIDLGTRLLDDELVPLDQITRVDFARGPRAFEMGDASEAGAIALVTEAVAVEPTAQATIGAGTQGAWNSALSWSGPLGTTGVGATVAIDRRVLPDFLHQLVMPDADPGKRQNDSARIKLSYASESIPDLTAELSALSLSGDSSDRWITPPPIKPGETPAPFDPFDRNSYAQEIIAHTHARGAAAFVRYERSDGLVLDMHASDTGIVRDSVQPPLEYPHSNEHEDRRRVGISARGPIAQDWTMAVDAERVELDIRTRATNLPAGTAGINEQLGEFSSRQTSGSVWIEHAWNSEWSTGIGVRWLRESATNGDIFFVTDDKKPFDNITTDAYDRSVAQSLPLPRAVIEWHPWLEHTFSLSYGSGYRSAGSDSPGTSYHAEQEGNIELAWHARWLDDAVHTSVTAFDGSIRNRFTFSNPDPLSLDLANHAQAHVDGLEFELQADLGARWHARAGLGLLDAHYRNYAYFDLDLSGQRLPGAPSNTALLGLRYGEALGWYGAADAYHAGAAETGPLDTPSRQRPPYSLLALRAGYKTPHLDVSLIGSNVLDEKYIDRTEIVSASQNRYRLGDPRRVDVRARWTW